MPTFRPASRAILIWGCARDHGAQSSQLTACSTYRRKPCAYAFANQVGSVMTLAESNAFTGPVSRRADVLLVVVATVLLTFVRCGSRAAPATAAGSNPAASVAHTVRRWRSFRLALLIEYPMTSAGVGLGTLIGRTSSVLSSVFAASAEGVRTRPWRVGPAQPPTE